MRPKERYRDLTRDDRRGRHRAELSPPQRRALALLLTRRPSIGLAALRAQIPGLPRNTAEAYVRRWRRLKRRRQRRAWRRLRWHVPGAVWAIDGTWLPSPVAPLGRRALIVVDPASTQVLALESVAGERADEAARVLERLIAEHGAPLVLKLDNGPAFVSQRFADFCRRHGITLLHSPVRQPRFNGCCEVSGRWAKEAANRAAERRGAVGVLSQADLDTAVPPGTALPHIGDAERHRFAAVVSEQLRVAAAERGVALRPALAHHVHRSLARVAVRRALVLCHILTIQDRAYRQWLPLPAA